MVGAMDGILGRIFSNTAKPCIRWLRQTRPQVATMQDHCQCGLRTLLAYFVAGDQALLEAEAGEPEESAAVLERARVLLHILAQLEIEALCDQCRLRLAPDCPYPAALSPPP